MVEFSDHLVGFCQIRLAGVQMQGLRVLWLGVHLKMWVFVFAVHAYVENSSPW